MNRMITYEPPAFTGVPVTIDLPSTIFGPLVINEPTASSITITGVTEWDAAIFDFTSVNAPLCRELIFPDLLTVVNPSIFRIRHHDKLESVSSPILGNLGVHCHPILFYELPNLTTLDLPLLANMPRSTNAFRGALVVYKTGLTALSLPSLAAISAPYSGSKVMIASNPSLASVALDALRADQMGVEGASGAPAIHCVGNPALMTVSVSSLPTDPINRVRVNLNGNALDVATVNALISQFEGAGYENPESLSFLGGTNAAPTGSALTTADARGWPHN
jgi:hypothetical protein